jgi:hypothetical protein
VFVNLTMALCVSVMLVFTNVWPVMAGSFESTASAYNGCSNSPAGKAPAGSINLVGSQAGQPSHL